jgi:hypothetical protein
MGLENLTNRHVRMCGMELRYNDIYIDLSSASLIRYTHYYKARIRLEELS